MNNAFLVVIVHVSHEGLHIVFKTVSYSQSLSIRENIQVMVTASTLFVCRNPKTQRKTSPEIMVHAIRIGIKGNNTTAKPCH